MTGAFLMQKINNLVISTRKKRCFYFVREDVNRKGQRSPQTQISSEKT